MNIEQVKEKIEDIKAFGDIPRYAVEIENGMLTICGNDGQFTNNPQMSGIDGYATFVGVFSVDDAIHFFNLKEE